ncbi:MAG: helix-turn-helix domain-containing protein [Clostridiales bacterium]|nr:helix-turn-helix domain-containing protein [Clostridiales bacterium]
MSNQYSVRQATELTGVKSHVLRYWEEEMNLPIGRNELGHRIYSENDIQLFLNIKELKNKGMQLRAIRNQLTPSPEIQKPETIPQTSFLPDENPPQKAPENSPADEKIIVFQQILDRLINQELQIKNEGETHCRSVDEAIRRRQLARREAAAASEPAKKKTRKRHG